MMKKEIIARIISVICVFAVSFNSLSQVKYESQLTNVSISGTSTLHDWEMRSSAAEFNAVFVLNNDQLTSISSLNFIIQSESLKSGHNLMDINTYKALKSSMYNNISFVLTSVNIVPQNDDTYLLKCFGKLTIAGTTRETDLCVLCRNAGDESFVCTGTKKIKMTDYNVKPPTVMGVIKTGDDILISYSCKINKE